MLISDWSSDVCSSDLQCRTRILPGVSMELVNLVDAGEIDMAAIIRPPFPLQNDLRWTTLALEPYRLIVPREVSGEDWAALLSSLPFIQIGRASCRERVCQYVKISVDDEALQKKYRYHTTCKSTKTYNTT